MKRQPIEQRFWSKVQKTETCWIWTGRPNKQGYGQLNSGGHFGKPIKAHRFSYQLHYGPIPEEICVLHRCDIRMCVRPDHLFPGDRPMNSRDMADKGRSTRGEKNPRAKITHQTAQAIRSAYAEGNRSYYDIGKEFNLDFGWVGRIVRNEAWKE